MHEEKNFRVLFLARRGSRLSVVARHLNKSQFITIELWLLHDTQQNSPRPEYRFASPNKSPSDTSLCKFITSRHVKSTFLLIQSALHRKREADDGSRLRNVREPSIVVVSVSLLTALIAFARLLRTKRARVQSPHNSRFPRSLNHY
jgi:arylamine N-acetyltransferase